MFEFESNQKIMVLSCFLQAVPGDLSQRNFGRSFVEVQRMAGHRLSIAVAQVFPGPVASDRGSVELGSGRVTHVFHSAARVNLTEPFDMMRKAAKMLEHTRIYMIYIRYNTDIYDI